jgi:hypothetical protein
MRQSRATALEEMAPVDAAFERLAPDLAAVFFIPTKYRVITSRGCFPRSACPTRAGSTWPACATNSTCPAPISRPALIRRSEALLAAGRFTWWRDDTHWNGAGIDAAAEVVAVRAPRARAQP